MDNLDLVDYSRQQQLDHIIEREGMGVHLQTASIIIIGCGGIGFWAGIVLAMMGVQKFVLIDGDKIETSNLNRLPVPQTWIGFNKAVALKRIIRMLRPITTIAVVKKHIVDENDVKMAVEIGANCHGSILIDTTDDARIQKKIYEYKKTRLPYTTYVKIGYEGFKVGAYRKMDTWIPDDYRPGYTTTQANALSSLGSAVIGILSAMFRGSDDPDFTLDFKKLIEPKEDK